MTDDSPAPKSGEKRRVRLIRVLRHFWWALGQLYYELITLTLKVNIMWTLTVLPLILPGTLVAVVMSQPEARESIADRIIPPELLVIAPVMTAIVLLIAGPGTAALYHSAHNFIELEPVTFGMFWRGFKKYFVRGWLLGVVDLAALFVCFIGFAFYWFSGELFQQIIAILFIYLLLFWVLMQPYLYVLLVSLDLNVYHTIRNSAVLVIGNPGASIGLAFITLLSAIFVPIFNVVALIVGPCVVAFTGHRVIADLLEAYGLNLEESGG